MQRRAGSPNSYVSQPTCGACRREITQEVEAGSDVEQPRGETGCQTARSLHLQQSVVLFQHNHSFDGLSLVVPVFNATRAAQVFEGILDFKAASIKSIQDTL